ncbi:hypothetical protein AHAS_Ahas06G0153500 [Arachis hypogaea]
MLQIFIPSYRHVFTHKKFREVQTQVRGKVNCITRLTQSAIGYLVFEVFAVTYNGISSEVKCQCLLFELRGILCRHSLSALTFERVNKNIKRRRTHMKSNHDEPLMEPRSRRFDDLVFQSQNICKCASKSKVLTWILHRAYEML